MDMSTQKLGMYKLTGPLAYAESVSDEIWGETGSLIALEAVNM